MIDAHVHIETRPYRLESIWEYVLQAEAMGIKELYLLEHSHRFHEFRNLYRHILMDESEVGTYQREWLERKMKRSLTEYTMLIEAMRYEEFPVKIHWGLEICYFSGEASAIKEIVSGFDWDFLTGAVHWVDGWGFDHPRTRNSWKDKDINSVYQQYYAIMKEMICADLFDHVAHPDSLKCFGHYATMDLRPVYAEIARQAQEHRVKLEYNCGLHLNYFHRELGLNPVFLEVLQNAGVELITASDAHHPQDVGKYITEAKEMLNAK